MPPCGNSLIAPKKKNCFDKVRYTFDGFFDPSKCEGWNYICLTLVGGLKHENTWKSNHAMRQVNYSTSLTNSDQLVRGNWLKGPGTFHPHVMNSSSTVFEWNINRRRTDKKCLAPVFICWSIQVYHESSAHYVLMIWYLLENNVRRERSHKPSEAEKLHPGTTYFYFWAGWGMLSHIT